MREFNMEEEDVELLILYIVLVILKITQWSSGIRV